MGANLLSMLQGALGSGAADQIGKALGEDPAKIKSAMGGALPSILGGLMKSASTPDGLKNLTNAVDQADSGMLDNLGGLLGGGGGVQDVIKKGSSMLPNILGGNMAGGIADAITKSSGLGRNSVMSLLGMLLPMVLGFLGKQKKTMGLDMAGLGSLLAGQKGFLQGMLPAGLGDMLGMGNLGQAAASAIGGAAQHATGAANYAANQAASAGGGMAKMLIPVLVIAALAYAAYTFFGKSATPSNAYDTAAKVGTSLGDAAKSATDAAKTAADTVKDTAKGVVDAGLSKLADGLPGTFDGLKSSLAGIKDVESAKAALPKLKDAATAIESLSKGMSGLPDSLKKTVGDQVKSFLPTIEGKAKELLANEGIAGQIKTVLEGLIAKLKAMIAG